jgi:hypothetical protein
VSAGSAARSTLLVVSTAILTSRQSLPPASLSWMSHRTLSVGGRTLASPRNNNFATPEAEIYINVGARRAPNPSVTRQGKKT